jgi:hexosaminidase
LLTFALFVACNKDAGDSVPGIGDSTTDTSEDTGAPVPALGLVPIPMSVDVGDGALEVDADASIAWTGGGESEAELLAAALRASTGFALPVVEGDGTVRLVLDPSLDVPLEGYELDVGESGVTITAPDSAGLFWGTQTLRELLPPSTLGPAETDVAPTIPFVHIEDAPRFEWRGFMIDVARHFFPVGDLERLIDLMALHKLNRLHVHLTDDQGWRIEISSWPDLTAIGGSTEVGGGPGGFYTQAEWQALAAYGAARHITLVPEIDFPGHSHAALASYGELNEDGVPLELYTGADVITTPLWLDGEITYKFVEDVWTEVAAIAPGPWVHIGGDEAIDATPEEYAAFLTWLQGVIVAQGKTAIGWDEIGSVDLDAPYFAQYWWHPALAADAASDGATIISSPPEHAYLEMVQSEDATYGDDWAGIVTTQDAYVWDPVPLGVDDIDLAGVEAALWTEWIDTVAKMDFMTWPRLCAIAEVGWTADRDWTSFRERMPLHGERLDALGVDYYATPEIAWRR